jgi:hypothetical protein
MINKLGIHSHYWKMALKPMQKIFQLFFCRFG